MKFIKSIKARFTVVGHLFDFLMKNKMWWMIPMIVVLLGFFAIMIAGQSTPLGPFIYALF